jgi:ribosomal-protein-alanine N-acetyltransferase
VTPIETDRLVLRRYENSDLAALVPLANDWEVTRWLPHMAHPYTAEDGRAFIAQAQSLVDERREYQLAVVAKTSDVLVGTAGLHVSGRAIPELGYWLGRDYWARGYATEVARAIIDFSFKSLGLGALMARVFDGNIASERVLIKAGFALTEIHELPEGLRGHHRYGIYQRHA